MDYRINNFLIDMFEVLLNTLLFCLGMIALVYLLNGQIAAILIVVITCAILSEFRCIIAAMNNG